MTMWFDKKPGEPMAESSEEPGAVLLGDGLPDRVRLPPELGSRPLKVLGAYAAPCPKCRHPEPVRHLELADSYGVAECVPCGFIWYRRRT